MFETFGEFDSCHEINMAAEGLREEKDFDGLRKLAEENGLSDYVDDYITGQAGELCNVTTAAIGKLSVEKEEAAEWAPLADDIVDYLMGHCDDETFATAVRRQGKRITEAAKRIEKEARKHEVTTPGGKHCNYCGPMRGYQLIREYYTGGSRI